MTNKRLARRRGHDLERQVARDLREFDPTAIRNLEYQEGSVDICTKLPFAIQCKNQANPSVWQALREAESAANSKMPLAVVRRGKQTVAVLYWKDFLKILKR